jgi:hypothetical protein
MTQTTAYFDAVTADHITPIGCSHCAGNAHLVERLPAVTGDGRGELRLFACAVCQQRTEMFIRD